MPDVGDAVLDVCHSIKAHAKCKSRIHLRIDAAVLQHLRIHHAAAKDLYDSLAFASRAALALANGAGRVDFSARLGKGEKAWAEFCHGIFSVKLI